MSIPTGTPAIVDFIFTSETILLDTDILIKHYRAENKTETRFFKLGSRYSHFAISAITVFELTKGDSKPIESDHWENFFKNVVEILDFDAETAKIAAHDFLELKKAGKEIGNKLPDLFIAATAKRHQLRLATDNRKDFERFNLDLVDV